MYSFALHDISTDTTQTNWECPHTERDRIRVAYRSSDRGYLIRDSVIYPTAHDIVKPLVEGPQSVQEWWTAPAVGGDTDEREKRNTRDMLAGESEQENWCEEDRNECMEEFNEIHPNDNQEDMKNK